MNAVCTSVEGLWEEACAATLHAALALAHGRLVIDVEGQLAAGAGQDGQVTGPSDVVRWVSIIWTGRAHAAAGAAAVCLQNLSWETAVPKLSGVFPMQGAAIMSGCMSLKMEELAHQRLGSGSCGLHVRKEVDDVKQKMCML